MLVFNIHDIIAWKWLKTESVSEKRVVLAPPTVRFVESINKYECQKCTSVLSCYFVKRRFVEERFLHNIKVSDRLYWGLSLKVEFGCERNLGNIGSSSLRHIFLCKNMAICQFWWIFSEYVSLSLLCVSQLKSKSTVKHGKV